MNNHVNEIVQAKQVTELSTKAGKPGGKYESRPVLERKQITFTGFEIR